MLDNSNTIAQRDPQDALGFAAAQPSQLTHNFNLAHARFTRPIHSVVFAGMGGSSLVAEFVHSWPTLGVPYSICKDYVLPAFVNENTLVICGSYSGNTEETLSALDDARSRNAMIAILTHGGKLLEQAQKHNDVLAQLPECPQPRTSVLYAYRALVEIFVAAKLIPQAAVAELESVVQPLQDAVRTWVANVPTEHNQAKRIALEMAGKTPIIYAGPLMYGAAYKWKIGVNENAKNTAWCNFFPELSHNEFIGWASHPVEKPFACVNILSSFEHPRVIKRFEVTEKLLSGKKPAAITVHAQGKTVVEQLLYVVLLGDFTTTYLAILNNVNPTPVALVEKFKKELG